VIPAHQTKIARRGLIHRDRAGCSSLAKGNRLVKLYHIPTKCHRRALPDRLAERISVPMITDFGGLPVSTGSP